MQMILGIRNPQRGKAVSEGKNRLPNGMSLATMWSAVVAGSASSLSTSDPNSGAEFTIEPFERHTFVKYLIPDWSNDAFISVFGYMQTQKFHVREVKCNCIALI